MDGTVITRQFGKVKLGVKRNLDLIELGLGLGLITLGTVTIAKEAASDEFKETIANHKAEMAAANEEKDNKKKASTCAKTTGKLVRQFAKGVGEEVVGGTLVFDSHMRVRKHWKNTAKLLAAETAAFTAYRKRTAAEVGTEREKELYYGATEEEVVEVKEDGTTETSKVKHFFPELSMYCKVFDEGNVNFESDPEANRTFILNVQRWANQRLKAQGYLFLNDVLKDLGYDITTAGQYVGWIYDAEDGIGDNYISFRMYDGDGKNSIILDFNVDGDIMNRLHLERY